MIDKDKMLELAQAEDYAYYKGDLVLSLPRGSNTTEEMWDILMEMFKTSIAIQDEMRRHFENKCNSLHFCSKAGHPYQMLKRRFGFGKTRYKGLEKNRQALDVRFALANLAMVASAGRSLAPTAA